ncbi:MAG: adenosylcobinamide-phosphate synthase CbiB [Ilumatobacter sp.]
MNRVTALAVAAAWVVDRLVGEPPVAVHPVVLFGSTMEWMEQRMYLPTRSRGAAYTTFGLFLGVGTGALARRAVGAPTATVVVAALAMAPRMLEDEGRAVARVLAAGDLAAARDRVGGLVGRETGQLTEANVCRAAIESLAENTVDAVTATTFWASVGGAPGAAAHRCVNTMDAMVGHHSERFERFGWASARLDDLANWVPARLTTLAIAAARPHRSREILRTARRDAPQHPSPNGGLVEAAFAAALGVKLGGSNVYGDVVDDRGELGAGRPPQVGDIERAVVLSRTVGLVSLTFNALGLVSAQRLVRQLARWR